MSIKHNLKIKSESGYKVEEIELIEVASHYFLKELDLIEPFGIIHGEIIVVGEVLSESVNEPLSGDMSEIKNHILPCGTQTNYYICRLADYTNSIETIRTLAHELIHVWQTARGVLKTSPDNEWFWKGRSHGFTPYNGSDDDYLLPWEAEADILDVKLTKKFYTKYFEVGCKLT